MGSSIHLLLAILILDLQQESSFAVTFLSKIRFGDFSNKKFQLSKLKIVGKSNFKQKIYFCTCFLKNTLVVFKQL